MTYDEIVEKLNVLKEIMEGKGFYKPRAKIEIETGYEKRSIHIEYKLSDDLLYGFESKFFFDTDVDALFSKAFEFVNGLKDTKQVKTEKLIKMISNTIEMARDVGFDEKFDDGYGAVFVKQLREAVERLSKNALTHSCGNEN